MAGIIEFGLGERTLKPLGDRVRRGACTLIASSAPDQRQIRMLDEMMLRMARAQDLARGAHVAGRSPVARLSLHRFTAVRSAGAGNPATPLDVLAMLVEDHHHLPRYAVTRNPSAAAVPLALSATRPDVRVFLAQRGDLADDIDETLFNDPDREVRESLAWSTNRQALVSRFARTDERRLRAIAACRDLCPDEDFERLSRDPDNRVRAVVAGVTGRLIEDMVQVLARDRSANVRWHVLSHHPRRRDIAELLADDPDTMNAAQARGQLERD